MKIADFEIAPAELDAATQCQQALLATLVALQRKGASPVALLAGTAAASIEIFKTFSQVPNLAVALRNEADRLERMDMIDRAAANLVRREA